MVSTYLHNNKLILSRKKASMQASITIKQTFQTNIHKAHTISSQVRLKQGWTAEASHLYKVELALNLAIEGLR